MQEERVNAGQLSDVLDAYIAPQGRGECVAFSNDRGRTWAEYDGDPVVKHSGRAATVGYCWGGTLSYLAACQLPLACAVVYYGKVSHLDQKPRCPVMYHYGREDRSIPLADIERTKAANPQAPLFVYEGAGHGFNCEQREAYNPQVAALARTRTLDFLGRHVAGGEPLKG